MYGICCLVLVGIIVTHFPKSGQAEVTGDRGSRIGAPPQTIGGTCDPIKRVQCLSRFTNCTGIGGSCICIPGYQAKFFYPADKEGCFIEAGHPCDSELFEINFGEELSGNIVFRVIDRKEKELRTGRVSSGLSEAELQHLLLFYSLWKMQATITTNPLDWACLSGHCDPAKRTCRSGLNPVLLESRDDPLPTPKPTPGTAETVYPKSILFFSSLFLCWKFRK